VLALDQDQDLARLSDQDVLAFATEQQRILITHDVRDFARIAQQWAEAGRSHGGCIIVTLSTTAYGAILRGLMMRFEERPSQEEWKDRTEFLAAQDQGQVD